MPETHPARRPPGELEASVLAALWAAGGPLTPADVQRDLGRALARTTVTTILARLHDKGAVARTRSGRGYAYTPTQDSPGLAARRMRTELDKEQDRETVLARFVSQLSPDDEQLLRALLDDAEPGTGEEAGTGAGAEAGTGEGGGSR
ncbi:BlaI/MecI/CopY family transcriptional regulator [Streptomyces sp. RKAG337]|uniref:BlaI/MecI/CopY family transcriptional regulator n=1 Tax=Streptomyces sp. RKAG337 TaxID=2893404 RepID=UPI002034231D|nr:BlaI/MecI/CopY family transcriptional regulator [Streptomyces sp. RKAG337]MCM2427719.1 BlaI/MecI/CopY family transcriptional regulator [Streptomyces sp. RKAG337]